MSNIEFMDFLFTLFYQKYRLNKHKIDTRHQKCDIYFMAPSDSQKPLTENNGQEEQKYQNILDEYAKQVKPEPPVEDSTPISSEAPPHLPLQSSESPPVDPTAVGPVPPTTIPEHPPVKDPAVDSLSLSSPPPSASPSSPDPGSQLPPTPPSVPPSVAVAASAAPRRSSGFFKVLFLLSLVVFLLVYGAIAYNFFFKKAPLPTPSLIHQVPTDNLSVTLSSKRSSLCR